jgi:prepilin-type N-terminal cleavage/methylation domain-containing protein
MNKLHKGFTLIELLIVIAIIAIIGAIIASAVVPKKAGAADMVPVIPAIPIHLNSGSAQYFYSDEGSLYIFDAGTHPWQTAEQVCIALKRVDSGLKRVTLKTVLAESIKIDAPKLPTTSFLSEAVCN